MVRGERTAVLLVMEVEYSKLLSDIFPQVGKSRENAFFHESELLGCELKVFILSSWIEQRTNPSKVSDNSGSLLFNLWIFLHSLSKFYILTLLLYFFRDWLSMFRLQPDLCLQMTFLPQSSSCEKCRGTTARLR